MRNILLHRETAQQGTIFICIHMARLAALPPKWATRRISHNKHMSTHEQHSDLPIRDTTIRLGQALKLGNLVEDGTQARRVIEDGLVKVNGNIEDRRGRQLHDGETITLNGMSLTIRCPHSPQEHP